MTRALDREGVRILCAGLFLHPDDAHSTELRRRAEGIADWTALLPAMELHGVLPLLARNLRLAHAALPPEFARTLVEREEALREEGLRNGFTLARLLPALGEAGIDVTLLKGAALAQDVYLDPLLRSQGDVDILIEAGDLRRCMRAGEELGLLPSERALPTWWYRWTHYHAKLQPVHALLQEVELHWRLHSPAALLTVRHRALLRRRQRTRAQDVPVWTLDPLDRALHLVTHLERHARGVLDADELREGLRTPPFPVRAKWLLDLACVFEQLARARDGERLCARACEWSAVDALHRIASALPELVPLEARTRAFLAEVRGALAHASGAASEASPASSAVAHSARPLAGLDLRREAFALLPGWIWPPRRVLARRWGLPAKGALGGVLALCARPLQASSVLVRVGLAGLLLPAALLGRALARPSRRRLRARAAAPDAVLETAVAWRRWTRSSALPGPALERAREG